MFEFRIGGLPLDAIASVRPPSPYGLILLSLGVFVFWQVAGYKHFFTSLTYVAFFPLVVLGRLVRVLGRRSLSSQQAWDSLIFAVLTAGSELRFVKVRLLSYGAFLAGCILLLAGENTYVIWMSILCLLHYLGVHFYLRIRSAFRETVPSVEHLRTIFDDFARRFYEKQFVGDATAEAERSEESEPKSEEQSRGKITYIRVIRLLYELQKSLGRLSRTHRLVGYFLVSLGWTAVTTVVTFGLIYWGLYQMNPSSFSAPFDIHFGHLLFYSLSTVFPAQVGDFGPATGWAMLFNGVEAVLGWVILGLLFYVLTTQIVRRGMFALAVGGTFES